MSTIFDQFVEARTTPQNGLITSPDLLFRPQERPTKKGTVLTGDLMIPKEIFGLGKVKHPDQILHNIFESNGLSIRSRFQQALLSFTPNTNRIETNDDSFLVPATVTSLSGIPMTNIPREFQFLRLFLENTNHRLQGTEFVNLMRTIIKDPPLPSVPANLESYKINILELPISTGWVGTIEAPELPLKQILAAGNRSDLHKILNLHEGDRDLTLRGGHSGFLTNIANVEVPAGYALRILTDGGSGNIRHLQSPIADPSFKGQLIGEFPNDLTLPEPGGVSRGSLPITAYRVQNWGQI